MRTASLALVLGLSLATASAQPVIDGDLADPQYVLLDDNAGGPDTGFGEGLSELNAMYVHVDVPSSTLYLGIAGAVEANFNKLLIFLDTRDGGYNTGDYGATGGLSGVDGFNPDNAFDPGFFADFVLSVTRGGDPEVLYANVVELAGSRASGASTDRFVTGPGSSGAVAIALIPATDRSTYDVGYEIAIPFDGAVADGATPLVVTHPAISAFPLVASADGAFLSNLTLSPASSGQGNFGGGPVDFGTLGFGISDPLAYTWFRTSDVAGWRQVGAPFLGMKVVDYAVQNHIQGIAPVDPTSGSIPNGEPNFQTYGGVGFGAGYRTYSSDGSPLNLATGNFWYLYDAMVSDRWVPLPFTLQAGGVEYAGLVGQDEYEPPADGTASFLMANPYAAPFDTAFLTETTGYTLSNSLFVWDPNVGLGGDYVEYDRASTDVLDRTVPVMSGFWADLTDTSGGTLGNPTFRFDPAGRVRPAIGVTRTPDDRRAVAFELDLLDGDESYLVDRTTRLVFAEGGAPGVDAFDAAEPPTIASQHARLSFVDGDALRAVVGRELDPTVEVTTRLAMASVALGEQTYRLRWDAEALPAGWAAEIRDLGTGAVVDLRTASALTFTATDGPAQDRFELTVTASSVVAGETAPENVAEVLAPRPNPSAGTASMRVRVDRPQAVRVEAFDLLGRRVATAFDGTIETALAVPVDASGLAPGVYVLRVTGETFAAAHRLVVAR